MLRRGSTDFCQSFVNCDESRLARLQRAAYIGRMLTLLAALALQVTFGARTIVDAARPSAAEPRGRTLRVGVWYPAAASRGPTLTLGDVATALGTDPTAVLRARATIARRAPLAGARGRLVVLAPGYRYESPITHAALAEQLARAGFVAVVLPLRGARLPWAELDAEDEESFVRDIMLVATTLRDDPRVLADRVALVGFDYGGMAAFNAAMRLPNVDALVSLDAGLAYAHNLPLLRAVPGFDPARVRAALLHVTPSSAEVAQMGAREDDTVLRATRYAERRWLRVPGMRHVDFTTYGLIAGRAPTHAVFDYVARFLRARLDGDAAAANTLTRLPTPNASIIVTPGRAAPPDEASIVHALSVARVDSATRLLRAGLTIAPDASFLRQSTLNALGYRVLELRNDARLAATIFRLNVEAFPRSGNAHDSLGDGLLALGDTTAAIASYRRSLELTPDNTHAAELVRRLTGRR